MPGKMTPTAWSQGLKKALICSMAVLVVWCALALGIWLVFNQPLLASFDIACAVLCGLVLLVFLGTWLHGRTAAGRVLLDCGPHPTRGLFLILAVLFLVSAFTGGLAAASGSTASGLGDVIFRLSFAAFSLIMATGRLQVRENGIWQYWSLLRWGKIGSYHWANDSTLLVRPKGFLGLFQGALPVPPEHRPAVEEFLVKYGSVQGVSEPAAAPDRPRD